MTLSTKIYGGITARLTDTNDLGTLEHKLNMASLFQSMNPGTGDNQADALFDDQRTLVAEATEDLDLDGGIDNPFGDPISFATVKAILVKASADNNSDVVLFGQDTNGFQGPLDATTDTVAVPPGGIFLMAAPVDGWTVGSGNILTVTNGGNDGDVVYDIVIVGVSA